MTRTDEHSPWWPWVWAIGIVVGWLIIVAVVEGTVAFVQALWHWIGG